MTWGEGGGKADLRGDGMFFVLLAETTSKLALSLSHLHTGQVDQNSCEALHVTVSTHRTTLCVRP